MNLIIKQLASKHALYVDGGNGKTNYTFTQESLEEFTNFIVRKCADIAGTAEPYKAEDLIKQHFGVE
jgi:hypothetical protein